MNQTIRLSIPDMKCNGCVSAIENALSEESGVQEATVDLATKSATVMATVPLSILIDVIKTAGFTATELPAEEQDLTP